MRTSPKLPCSLLEFLAEADRTAAMLDRDGDRLAASTGGVIHRGMAQELRARVARVRALESTRDRSRGPSSTELRREAARRVRAVACAAAWATRGAHASATGDAAASATGDAAASATGDAAASTTDGAPARDAELGEILARVRRTCPVRGVAATAIALSLRGWAAFARERLGDVVGVDPAALEALAEALDAHRAEAKASAAARRATLEQRARWVAELADRVATVRAAVRWDRAGRGA